MTNSEPRLILICCEGQTEEGYFNAIVKIRRISNTLVPPAKSFGSQHTQLIDICDQERLRASQVNDLSPDDIEVWAVFDKDHWRNGFTSLEQYASQKNVKLAYSDPQFEAYLLQHLSADASRLTGQALESHLSQSMQNAGHGPYSKGELKWLEKLLDERPKTLEMAILNSNSRSRRTRSPFLTVHKLTERLLEFEPK